MTDITKEAQEIFGDIVVKAESKYRGKYRRTCGSKSYLFDYDEDGRNDFDADTVVITFINGRIIEIGNSEWGHIRRIYEQTN